MITKDEIRTTLSDIRFYYANIKSFQNALKYVGENRIVKTAEKFNKAIENAPPKLYELYIRLYVNNGTMASVAVELNYSIGYINKLNNSLVKYLYNFLIKTRKASRSSFFCVKLK